MWLLFVDEARDVRVRHILAIDESIPRCDTFGDAAHAACIRHRIECSQEAHVVWLLSKNEGHNTGVQLINCVFGGVEGNNLDRALESSIDNRSTSALSAEYVRAEDTSQILVTLDDCRRLCLRLAGVVSIVVYADEFDVGIS